MTHLSSDSAILTPRKRECIVAVTPEGRSTCEFVFPILTPGLPKAEQYARPEVVVPLTDGTGRVVGVLDIDSDHLNAFDDDDRQGLEDIVATLTASPTLHFS